MIPSLLVSASLLGMRPFLPSGQQKNQPPDTLVVDLFIHPQMIKKRFYVYSCQSPGSFKPGSRS